MTVVKTSLRNFLAHKGRMALSAIAVLLSVGFVCGTLVFTDTMTATFDKLFAATAADVTVSSGDAPAGNEQQTTSKAATVPASLVARLRAADGVKAAVGDASNMALTVVTSGNDNLSPSSGAPTIGTNWDSTELRTVELTSGHAPRGPTELMVDKDTADKHHLKLGDELRVLATPVSSGRRSPVSPPSRPPTPARPSSTSTPRPPRPSCSARPASTPTSCSPPTRASATRG